MGRCIFEGSLTVIQISSLQFLSSDRNSTDIEDMLLFVNEFGLSHLCAEQEFDFLGNRRDYNFPYLDIHVRNLFQIRKGLTI